MIPTGVKMLGAELEWPECNKGEGTSVAVLDSGVPNHPDLTIAGAAQFAGTTPNDVLGHSTHVCGIIAADGKLLGVAPKTRLYVAKVTTDMGGQSDEAIAQGVLWAIDQRVDVVNISLGLQNYLPLTHEAIKKAYAKGISVVCAVGNTSDIIGVSSPARYPETIAVTAINQYGSRADFTSTGSEVEIAALGSNVYSTDLNGTYKMRSGTSMASPHIAGAILLMQAKEWLRAKRKLTIPEIRLLLRHGARDAGALGLDPIYEIGRASCWERV